MARIFDRNMFIMLLSIMIGVIIITYFIADIVARTSTEEKLSLIYEGEKKEIEEKNLNFTSAFLDSLLALDLANDFKSKADVKYQISKSFYKSALDVDSFSDLENFKEIIIDNCTDAMQEYYYSSLNFNNSIVIFTVTKNYTTYDIYHSLLDLYINLSKSGYKLSLIKYNASKYLIDIAENLTLKGKEIDISMDLGYLMDLFNSTEYLMELESEIFESIRILISEYDLIEIRKDYWNN
jgi:hypothetical protein